VNDPHLEKFTSPKADGAATALIGYEDVAGCDAPGSPAPKALRIETNANAAEPYSHAGAVAPACRRSTKITLTSA